MSYYLNPPQQTDLWLVANGVEFLEFLKLREASGSTHELASRIWSQLRRAKEPSHPVVWTEDWAEAGIAYSKRELEQMLRVEWHQSLRVFAVPDRLIIQLEPRVRNALEPLA